MTAKYQALNASSLRGLLRERGVSEEIIEILEAVASVLPFRVNRYIVEELIDWQEVPDDPIFQLVFPQPGMLPDSDLQAVLDLRRAKAPEAYIDEEIKRIRASLNPHPGGQLELNVPTLSRARAEGIQHKYRETVLFFPREGQTCHAYCSYCFRWAQFVGDSDLKFSNEEANILPRYLSAHPEVTDVIFTGGDPMIMGAKRLKRLLDPIIEIETVQNIRIGTKSQAWWPQRFVSASDADELMGLLDSISASGKHLTIMAHYSHPRELEVPLAQQAIGRIRDTGAIIRGQAPLVRHVNDSSETWAALWREQVRHGVVPYYMFVERDTGAYEHFRVPLAEALEIFTGAYSQVSGLSRTVRGPVMSCTPGKVLVDGVATVEKTKVFVLKLIQARDPSLVNQVFFAHYDPSASWIEDLRPAFAASWPWASKSLKAKHTALPGRAANANTQHSQ